MTNLNLPGSLKSAQRPRKLRPRDLPPWLISVALHGLILLVLLNIAGISMKPRKMITVDTTLTDLDRDFEFTQMADVDMGNSTVPNNSVASSLSAAPNVADAVTPERLEERLPNPTVTTPLSAELPEATALAEMVNIKGAEGEFTAGGAAGAIDRLTLEIKRSLEQRKTLVIWALDSSLSLGTEREMISKKFKRVYDELGLLGQREGDALLTAIVSFGSETKFMTEEPTSDFKKLRSAVASIDQDENGRENVFQAINLSAQKWEKYGTRGRRNIMIVAVTDERGDDDAHLEECLRTVNKNRIPVYVLGCEAVFGRLKGKQLYVDENGDNHLLDVDRGPESPELEWFDLPYWYGRGTELFASGFGPWGLTRLCRESGGIYFIFKEATYNGPTFDPNEMREYRPDYCSRREYQQMIADSRFRQGIIKTAQITRSRPTSPTLFFPAFSEQAKQGSLRRGQEALVKLEYLITPGLREIRDVADVRETEESRRWRAQFDLLYGRLLATKVRCYLYNAMCAKLRKNEIKFKDKSNNAWRLVPDEEVPDNTPEGSALVRAAEEARMVLERCVAENEGTPWAMLAQRELEYEFGFRWEETKMTPPGANRNPNRPTPNNNNRPATMKKPVKLPKL